MLSLVISLLLAAAGVLALHALPFHPIISYTAAFIGSSVFFLIAAFLLMKRELSERALYAFLALAFLVRLSFLWTPPVGSDDLYRYVWDGKVQAAGINPYAYAPESPALAHLSTPELPSRVNHPELKTLYFPLAEWIFYASYEMSGGSVWGIKLLILLAEMCAVWGLFLLTGALRVPRRFILLYALCPLILFEYAVDAHIDAFGLPLLVFSLYYYFGGRKLPAMILLGLSLLIKPTALVLLPVFFFAEKEWKARLMIVIVPLLTLGLAFAPYFISVNPLDGLTTFTKNWSFNGFVFNVLNAYIQNNQLSRLICSALLAVAVLLLSLSRRGLFEKIYYAVLLLLLFSPVVHPWYVGWLAVLVPAARRWSGMIYVSTLSLTCFTYIGFQLHGVWKEEPLWWLMEYLPVVAALVIELLQPAAPMQVRIDAEDA